MKNVKHSVAKRLIFALLLTSILGGCVAYGPGGYDSGIYDGGGGWRDRDHRDGDRDGRGGERGGEHGGDAGEHGGRR